jgi:hypothetical protein
MYRLAIQCQHLFALTKQGILDAAVSGSSSEATHAPAVEMETNVWIPLPIVQQTLLRFVKKEDKKAESPVSVSQI